MLYRLFTEDINRDLIKTIANSYYEAYTLLTGTGTWHGTEEDSLLLEVIGDDTPEEAARFTNLARAVKMANSQEAVLIQSVANNSQII